MFPASSIGIAALGHEGPQFGLIRLQLYHVERAHHPIARLQIGSFLVILADDMGFSDIGAYGSEIPTPSIDRLAAMGLRFTQFYNAARCCPTRAALLTGLYPHQAGVGHMVADRDTPGYRGRLAGGAVTIAEVLRDAGYRTLLSGKWHVGEDRPHWPVDRGFDRSFALVSGASSYFRLDEGRRMALDAAPFTPPDADFYMTDAITEHAVRLIAETARGDAPFFLYVAYTAPHWPLHALREDIARHRGKYAGGWDALRRKRHRRMLALGVVRPEWALSPRPERLPAWETVEDKESWDLRMAVYAAQVERMDRGVGRIVAAIEAAGKLGDTLILFLSDNGASPEVVDRGKSGAPAGSPESYLSYGPSWANASNTPFRLGKARVHEGGIATPLVACWPARIQARGGLAHEPGHVIDILATCLDAAGVSYPRERDGRPVTPLEGRSLLPVLEGRGRSGHEAIFWEHQGNRAVRRGKWKLVALHGKDWELYDLEADRTELHDVARERPDLVKELEALYASWAERCGVLPWRPRARV
jgi:arylsulfatase